MRWPVILRILLPLLFGVILHFYTGFSLGVPFLAGLLGILILLNIPFRNQRDNAVPFTITMTLFFFLLGGFLSEIHKSIDHTAYFTGSHKLESSKFFVKVIEPPEQKEKSVKCVVEVLQRANEQTVGKTLIYIENDEQAQGISYGDYLVIQCRFSPVQSNGNPKEFDYARYLRIHNIHHQAFVKSNYWKVVDHKANPFMEMIHDWRQYLSSIIKESGISEKNKMVANALLLGQKEYLDKEVLRSFSSAGAMHVLAVSGLHVGIIMLILTNLLRPIKRIKFGKKLFLILVLGGIWVYALITGASPSVLRASVMFTFIVIGGEIQRDTTIYQSILTSAFLLILIEPYIIFQVGFQLSYLAVLGIVYLQPKIENLMYVKNKILFKGWQITAVSIAAQIATFPLGLYYFHQFPNFFMISNLIVIPLAFLILIIGIAYLVFHAIPLFGDFLLYLLDKALTFLNNGVAWIEELPYSIVWGISIEWYEVFLLYMTILLGSIAFINRKKKYLWMAICGVLLLLSLNISEKIQLESKNQLVIYNISDELAVDIFYGRKNIFYSSEKLKQNEEKLLFHVKHNWFYRSGQEEPYLWKSIKDNQLFEVGGQSFWLADSVSMNSEALEIPNSNYVVLHNLHFIDSKIIETLVAEKKKVILASNLNYKLKSFLHYKMDASLIYDLNQEGAFVYEF